MNQAMARLREYQKKHFKGKSDGPYPAFDWRAYPQTATGVHLDGIGHAIRITARKAGEACTDFRARIITHLETPDPIKKKEEFYG